MSHSERDQRGRPHSGKRFPDPQGGGCVWCHTGDQKPHQRRVERRTADREIREQISSRRQIDTVDDPDDAGYDYDEHVYVAGRCIRCGVSSLDVGVYPGLDLCPGKESDEPIVFSTETGGHVVYSHPIDD